MTPQRDDDDVTLSWLWKLPSLPDASETGDAFDGQPKENISRSLTPQIISDCDDNDEDNEDDEDEVQNLDWESPEFSIDHYLSKQINKMSFQDRTAFEEETHGVSSVGPQETPEFLEQKLAELSVELAAIPDDQPLKQAYLESQVLPERTYIDGANFRLRFLRCELFDAKKAALRMVKFLDLALEFYGPQILQRPIKLKDLTKDERKLMRVGNLQVLPYRDRSGRPVVALVGDIVMEQGTLLARSKTQLYLINALSEDVESQQKGMTFLVWMGPNPGARSKKPGKANREMSKRLHASIPLRLGSFHMCLPDEPKYHFLRTAYGLTLGKHMALSRLRFHIGERTELLYQLKTYGIAAEWIPVTEAGNVKITHHKQWMQTRQTIEDARVPPKDGNHETEIATAHASDMVDFPRSKDVVFRGGTDLLCHPGNSRFQGLLESQLDDHVAASIADKRAITKSIIRAVHGKEGRFLQWNKRKGCWIELKDASEIHGKVAEKIRRLTQRRKQHSRRQTANSSTHDFCSNKRRKLSPDDSAGSGSENSACCF